MSDKLSDDDALVDVEWLCGLSTTAGFMGWLRVRFESDSTFHLMSPCSQPSTGIEGLNDWVSPKQMTRGDVRALARVLGLVLLENNHRRATVAALKGDAP